MKKLFTSLVAFNALVALGTLSATPVLAQDLSIKVTNLTNAIYFTPLIVAAHNHDVRLFIEGSAASANLQAMAEGGNIDGLVTDANALGADVENNPAEGLLAPGANISFSFMTADANNHLSLAAMMLPTNDGFVGADSIEIPTAAGTYTYYLNAYDAGTEANNEVINGGGASGVLGIPVDPGANAGTNGTGITNTTENNMIHIHRGNIGDSDLNAGNSDLTSTVHRWLNPVAQLVITVN